MEEDLHKIWRCLRPTVKDGCTFAMIKDLVATSGLPVEKLSHLQQRSIHERGGASKGELLDAVGDLIEKANEPTEAIRKLIAALLEMNPDLGDKVLECAQRFGWTVLDGQLRPSEFQVEEASDDFGEEVRQSLRTAYERHGQNDYPGAMTAVCSALDSLARRRSFCISTDPEFVSKAAANRGPVSGSARDAVVVCVDEKSAIQALERAHGWLKLPNGKALTGFNHEYKRNDTTTLFAALNVATGLVKTGHFK